MSAWQDIASAPKDGTWVLLYDPEYKNHYDASLTHWIAKYGFDERYHIDAWFDQDGIMVLRGNDPTHWMPLPEPPTS